MLIEGIFAAATTPFYPDERLYLRKLEANIARYSRSLLAGILVLGSTGEAPALSEEESRQVMRIAADAAAPEKVLIAGVGRDSVISTVALAEAAAASRYDAVLVRTPTYYSTQMSEVAVLNYFRAVADRSPLPVLLYNIPRCVPYDIPVSLIAELAHHPNIIGIKDSSGNLERLHTTLAAVQAVPKRKVTVTPVFEAATARMLKPVAPPSEPSTFVSAESLGSGVAVAAPLPVPALRTRTKEVGFQVLTGSASILFDSLEAGASGGVLGLAACVPQACTEIYLAWKDHDLALAREKQERVQKANRRIVAEIGVAGVKYACDFNGFYGGQARLPLLRLNAEQKAEIESLLAEIRN
jgi:dihydrodipicolinate synthase/N-acetylneuraminate lyase